MRIRSVFLLSIALGSAVGIVAAVLFTMQQWSAFQSARSAEHDTRLLLGALRLPETMNIERAFINPRLVDAAAATPDQLVPILRQTTLVDATISEALRLTDTPDDTATLKAIRHKLLDVRKDALEAIARPRMERPEASVDNFLQQMFAVQEAAYALAVRVQLRITVSNPHVGQATQLAVLAWELRDWSGRQTTTLISYIGLHLPMAGEQAEVLAGYKGRIDQEWLAIRAAVAAVDSPDISEALTGVERGFWSLGGEAYATQVLPNRGRTLNLDPDRFVAFIRPILDSILPLRDSALREALQRASSDIAVRREHLLLAMGLVLLTACAAAAASRWFDHRVVRPIGQITTTILGLAGGNRNIQVLLQDRTDELGEMAKAIEALRCNAIQAEAIGHEILVLQHARAEEKSRLLAELTQSNVDLAALNLELESLATTDALTGVPNRRSFDLTLAREWRRAQREETSLGLLLLDVDHFKAFNDRYGHPAGDACLARLAMAISNAVRRPTDITARYGGEEFAVVLPSTELEGAANIAECVRRAVVTLNIQHLDNPCGVVTVSIGASVMSPRSSQFPQALVNDADSALYAAKHRGRNLVATAADANPILQGAGAAILAVGRAG